MQPEQPRASRDRIYGLARVALAGLIWGSIPLVIRAADGASVVKVFFRVFCAALAVGGWMVLRGELGDVVRLERKKRWQLVVQGLILTLNWMLFLTALDMTNVATAELLGYTGPIFVAALAPAVTREPFDRKVMLPLALALAGIVIILAPAGIAVRSRSELVGAGLAFASALTYAVLLLRSKKMLRGVSSATLMLVEYSVASLVLSPFVMLAYARGQGPTNVRAYAALVTLGLVHTALAGFIFLGGMRRVRTDHAAILTYVEPASAVIFAALLLAEPLTASTVLGGALVVAGGALVARVETGPPLEMADAEWERDG